MGRPRLHVRGRLRPHIPEQLVLVRAAGRSTVSLRARIRNELREPMWSEDFETSKVLHSAFTLQSIRGNMISCVSAHRHGRARRITCVGVLCGSSRLDLEIVKYLLEMAKLELNQEMTVIISSAVQRHKQRIGSRLEGAPTVNGLRDYS